MKSSLPGGCEASIARVLPWVSCFRSPKAMGAVVRKDHLVQKPLIAQSQSLQDSREEEGRSIWRQFTSLVRKHVRVKEN